ncbi:low molecular weight phosphatase family protein [Pseudoroseicyclus aestuarii]|uniref:Protein tyrosine phosphatase n=1 Tax=Pseudoroseicyclus aestuarii TaxID=1795041 RepID=A0A318SNT7_9RHOB|nr:low molecular weight phosphatase family protein [Pseudoroseicyclus aestuarii]PYE82494.1 protein tyrosine phosphatase [Pseudoroseicyclus aestuarii]
MGAAGTAPKTLPQAVLFCCDHNAIRSPMAEGIMKKLYGEACYVQSVGLRSDAEIDGFAIAVCAEIGVELSRHRSRSFDGLIEEGDDLSSYDLVVALSEASRHRAEALAERWHMAVEYWPLPDPGAPGAGEGREARLDATRRIRDAIQARLKARWAEG